MLDRTVIMLVDDDETQLALVGDVLEREGYAVQRFVDPACALDHCLREAPSLVISDIMMPEIGGFELQSRYARQFPERTTPFVFLSSLGDAHTITRGLDAGADDYLQKPVDPAVLKARVRAILRRRRRTAQTSFRGDLEAFPLSSLLRFCEAQGLTGYVDFFAGDTLLSLRFRAGQMDDPSAEATLTRLSDLTAAPFVVHSAALDFTELRGARARVLPPASEPPLGRLSTVRLHSKVFQVQTELVGDDPRFVVSVVLVDARTVWKHAERVPDEAPSDSVAAAIDRLHDHIEQRLNDRMAEELLRRATAVTGRREEFHELFDQGFDRFRAQDFTGAIACWERALVIEPTNAALPVNIKIAREKIAAAG